jgi:hypothetical protein
MHSKIFLQKKGKYFLKVGYMRKQNAIKYLKLLHTLEQKYSDDLFAIELKEIVEYLRLEFLKHYQNKGV